MSTHPFSPDTPIGEFLPFSTHVSPTVLKTTGGDFLLTWRLDGLPFVGREEWDIEHKHNAFNRMLQTLRAPDFTNVAFWVHAGAPQPASVMATTDKAATAE
jgi:type IV secretion system protein VirB4